MTAIVRPLAAGVETVSVSCSLGRNRPSDRVLDRLRGYSFPHGARYLSPEKVPGVSRCSVERRPTEWALVAEFNLTTLLHGAGSEVGSLSAGEVPLAAARIIPLVESLLPGVDVPDLGWMWDVTRFDPSTTLLMPADFPPSVLVAAAHHSWRLIRQSRQTLSLHESSGVTATLRVREGHSRSVYDKTAQATKAGKDCPPGALRLESRMVPKLRPTLDNLGVLVSISADEITALAASVGTVMRTSTHVTVHTLVEAQRALGEEPNVSEALLLASFSQLLAESGDISAVTAEGMTRSTAYRRRARLWKLMAAADEEVQDRAAADIFGMSEVLLARQLVSSVKAAQPA